MRESVTLIWLAVIVPVILAALTVKSVVLICEAIKVPVILAALTVKLVASI